MSQRTIQLYRSSPEGVKFSDHPISEEEWQKYTEAKKKGWVFVELNSDGWAVVKAGAGLPSLPLNKES